MIIKLNDKIKYIKRAFGTPYHFFFMTENKQITVVFENKKDVRYTFTGDTIFGSIETAEEYVVNEIKAGAIKEPDMSTKESKQKIKNKKEKKDEGN